VLLQDLSTIRRSVGVCHTQTREFDSKNLCCRSMYGVQYTEYGVYRTGVKSAACLVFAWFMPFLERRCDRKVVTFDGGTSVDENESVSID